MPLGTWSWQGPNDLRPLLKELYTNPTAWISFTKVPLELSSWRISPYVLQGFRAADGTNGMPSALSIFKIRMSTRQFSPPLAHHWWNMSTRNAGLKHSM